MTFESYDEQTVSKDIYMPAEKVINFNISFMKIEFIGKLRLTQANPGKLNSERLPQRTYGVIETDS